MGNGFTLEVLGSHGEYTILLVINCVDQSQLVDSPNIYSSFKAIYSMPPNSNMRPSRILYSILIEHNMFIAPIISPQALVITYLVL